MALISLLGVVEVFVRFFSGFVLILALLLPTAATAEEGGVGFLIWAALTRPSPENKVYFVCSGHAQDTSFSVSVYPGRSHFQIYERVEGTYQACTIITDQKKFLARHTYVQQYIDQALEIIRDSDTREGLHYDLLFNVDGLQKQSGLLSFLGSFTSAAYAENEDYWSVHLVMRERQNHKLVELDRMSLR